MKHKTVTVECMCVQLYVYAVLMCPRIHHMYTVWQDPIMQVAISIELAPPETWSWLKQLAAKARLSNAAVWGENTENSI